MDLLLQYGFLGIGFLGIGALLGYAVGLAFRSAARGLGCLLGIIFILLELLTYYQVVDLNWGSLEPEAVLARDLAHFAFTKLLSFMSSNIAFAAGFALGFLVGLRRE